MHHYRGTRECWNVINTGNYGKLHDVNGNVLEIMIRVRDMQMNWIAVARIELSLLYRRERDLHLVGVTALATLSRSMI